MKHWHTMKAGSYTWDTVKTKCGLVMSLNFYTRLLESYWLPPCKHCYKIRLMELR